MPETTFDPATLAYNGEGLIPAIAQDAGTGEVLMLAWMNAQSVAETLATGRVTYWSRSRGQLWRKGETSGHVQRLVELRLDCDRDCLLVLVEQTAPRLLLHRRPRRRRDRDTGPGARRVSRAETGMPAPESGA